MDLTCSYTPNIPWSIELFLLEKDGQSTDLTGVVFRMHVRGKINSSEILAIASSSNDKIEIISITTTYKNEPITGSGIKINLTAEDTLNIYQNAKNAVADIEAVYPDNSIIPKLVKLIFEPDLTVTRDF